jgi:hypothetical protein
VPERGVHAVRAREPKPEQGREGRKAGSDGFRVCREQDEQDEQDERMLVGKRPGRERRLGASVKRESAQGGCLGTSRRRRTWQAAKSLGELQASVDPGMSEWGNPAGVIPRHPEREANPGN